MQRWRISCLLLTIVLPGRLWALEAALPGAELRSEAVFRYWGLPIYEAQLYTMGGGPFDWNEDFGLRLRYLRNLSQDNLVDATMQEMERLGGALPVRESIEDCFLGVSQGDTYVAVTDGPSSIRFWRNGEQTCTLSYPQITYRFMSIFLGENTRSRAFTRVLRGE